MHHRDIAFLSNHGSRLYRHPEVSILRLLFSNRFWHRNRQKERTSTCLVDRIAFLPVEDYRLWDHLVHPMNFSRNFLISETLGDRKIDEIRRYFSKVVRYQSKKRLGLKITGPTRICFLRQIFPDAKFIYLERDVYSVVHSFMNVDFWRHRLKQDVWWQGAYSNEEKAVLDRFAHNDAVRTALQIQKIREVFQREKEHGDSDILCTTYEDFVADPFTIVSGIYDHLNLEYDVEWLAGYLRSRNIVNRNIDPTSVFNSSTVSLIRQISSDGILSLAR